MPKRSESSFLIAWCRQLDKARADGSELWYQFVDIIDETLNALEGESGYGTSADEVRVADGDGGEDAREDAGSDLDGSVQDGQPFLPGLGGVLGDVSPQHNAPRGVPPGTGGGLAAVRDVGKP